MDLQELRTEIIRIPRRTELSISVCSARSPEAMPGPDSDVDLLVEMEEIGRFSTSSALATASKRCSIAGSMC